MQHVNIMFVLFVQIINHGFWVFSFIQYTVNAVTNIDNLARMSENCIFSVHIKYTKLVYCADYEV